MAIMIVPREDQAPLKGEIVSTTSMFQPPSTIEPTRRHLAIRDETHEDAVQLSAVVWKTEFANRVNTQLGVSAVHHLIAMGGEISQAVTTAPPMDVGLEQIITPAVSAIAQQIAAHVQRSTLDGARNVSELSTKVPTGTAIIAAQDAEIERVRKVEEKQRKREEEAQRLAEIRAEEAARPRGFFAKLFG